MQTKVATGRFLVQLLKLRVVTVEPAPSQAQALAATENKAFKDISSFNNFWMTP